MIKKSVLGIGIIVAAVGMMYVMAVSAAQSIDGGQITVGHGYSNDYFLVEREQAHPDDKISFGSCSYEASRFIGGTNEAYPNASKSELNFAFLVNGRDYKPKNNTTSTVGPYPSPSKAPAAYPSPNGGGVESYEICFVNETLGIRQCGIASYSPNEDSHGISRPSETSNLRTLPFDDRCLAGINPMNAVLNSNVLFFPIVVK